MFGDKRKNFELVTRSPVSHANSVRMPNDGALLFGTQWNLILSLALIQLDKSFDDLWSASLVIVTCCAVIEWIILLACCWRCARHDMANFRLTGASPRWPPFRRCVKAAPDMLLTQAAVDSENFVVTQVCKQSSLPECVAAQNYDVCFLIECRATEKTWINSNQPFIGLWRIKSEAFIGRLGDCESARNAHFDFHQKLIKPTHRAIEPETDAGCDNDRHFCEHLLGLNRLFAWRIDCRV